MSNYSAGRGPYPADPHPRLGLAALTAVIAGVVLLAAAAFVLSYPGIHQLALRAGVGPGLAKLYPLIFDAMLVVAGAAALALRGAGWWPRAYAWVTLLLLIAVVAVGDAVRATNVALPLQPTRAVAAVTPWVLLLLAFGLLLEMLRHFRRTRTAGARPGQAIRAAAALAPAGAGQPATDGSAADGSPAAGTDAAARMPVTWAGADGAGAGRALPAPRSGLDLLLGPREADTPAIAAARPDAAAATGDYPGYGGHPGAVAYPDPVAYGPETGYVHPDSYRDPVVSQAGPEGNAGPAGNGGHVPGGVPAQPPPPAKPRDGAGSGRPTAKEPKARASRPATPPAPPGEAAPTAPAAPPAPGTPAKTAGQNGPAAQPAAQDAPGAHPAAQTPAKTAGQNGPTAPAAAPAPDAGSPAPATQPEAAQTTPDAQPETATLSEAAQTIPAEAPSSPPGDDPSPGTAASAATPWLERLHSTPAPPEE